MKIYFCYFHCLEKECAVCWGTLSHNKKTNQANKWQAKCITSNGDNLCQQDWVFLFYLVKKYIDWNNLTIFEMKPENGRQQSFPFVI